MSDLTLLLSCPRGLETILQHEIGKITNKKSVVDKGFVRLQGANWADVYRLNLHSRTASRVLCEVAHGKAENEEAVYRLAKSVDWQTWFSAEQSIKVRIEGKGAQVRSLNFVALKVKDAICDVFRAHSGMRPNVDKNQPDIQIHTFLNRTQAFIYIDTSGEALFKRGYRTEGGDAPLRENLAAGLLLLAGFREDMPFYDPMCGSGTIAIEAAWIAARRAPGLLRDFAFMRFRHFQPALWQEIRTEAESQIRLPETLISAGDKQTSAIKIALKNAQNAHVDDIIRFARGDMADVRPNGEQGLLLSNPPYGVRLGEMAALQAEYPAWSSCLKKHFAGWQVGFISADTALVKHLRLSPKRKIVLYNGALETRLYLFDMVAGTHR